jgi:hypothetical protein
LNVLNFVAKRRELQTQSGDRHRSFAGAHGLASIDVVRESGHFRADAFGPVLEFFIPAVPLRERAQSVVHQTQVVLEGQKIALTVPAFLLPVVLTVVRTIGLPRLGLNRASGDTQESKGQNRRMYGFFHKRVPQSEARPVGFHTALSND